MKPVVEVKSEPEGQRPRLYELINPSDAICFETADEEALCIGVILLGGGWFGLERDDGTRVQPLCAFGEAAEAAAERCDEFLRIGPANNARVAKALRSLLYCGMSERRALDAAFAPLGEAERLAAVARFNDGKRGSMNNIGARALALAAALEKPRPAEPPEVELADE